MGHGLDKSSWALAAPACSFLSRQLDAPLNSTGHAVRVQGKEESDLALSGLTKEIEELPRVTEDKLRPRGTGLSLAHTARPGTV